MWSCLYYGWFRVAIQIGIKLRLAGHLEAFYTATCLLFFASGICGRPLGLTLLCKIFAMLWVSLSLFSKLSPFELYSSALSHLCLRRSVVAD